jgi:PhnB protein
MSKNVKPIPDSYTAITPYLICKDNKAAVDFYQRAFGAEAIVKMDGPGGIVVHAEMKFGNAMVMMGEESPEMGFKSPKLLGGSTVGIVLYVNDCDAVVKTAVDAGAKILRPLKDQFYGDRSATLEDPFGHTWTVSTHKEDLTPQEIGERMKKEFGQ